MQELTSNLIPSLSAAVSGTVCLALLIHLPKTGIKKGLNNPPELGNNKRYCSAKVNEIALPFSPS